MMLPVRCTTGMATDRWTSSCATKARWWRLTDAPVEEKRRIEIEKEATDCLVFCDLSGVGRPTDVLVKNRYEQIWAYNQAGELLWTSKHPGRYRTAHQPVPVDLDGDGRDELIAGYACLNHDGSVRWVYESENIKLRQGHLDCARVLERGDDPGGLAHCDDLLWRQRHRGM
jgi:hypothetical protein